LGCTVSLSTFLFVCMCVWCSRCRTKKKCFYRQPREFQTIDTKDVRFLFAMCIWSLYLWHRSLYLRHRSLYLQHRHALATGTETINIWSESIKIRSLLPLHEVSLPAATAMKFHSARQPVGYLDKGGEGGGGAGREGERESERARARERARESEIDHTSYIYMHTTHIDSLNMYELCIHTTHIHSLNMYEPCICTQNTHSWIHSFIHTYIHT